MKNARFNMSSFKPQNHRLRSTDVDKQHEFYAMQARKQYMAALEASGIYGQIYQRMFMGTKCTCQAAQSLLDDNGELLPSSIDNVLENTPGKLQQPSFVAISNNEDDIGFDDFNDESDFSEIVSFGGFEQTQCSCCYGTGYVGGYTLQHGFHTCLNACSSTDHYLNKDERPYCYEKGTYGIFNITIPKIPNSKFIVRLWNKRDYVNDFTYKTPNFGIPTKLKIKTTETFTHVEVFLIPRLGVPIDFEQFLDMLGLDLYNDKLSTTFNAPPDCGIVAGSIVRDNKFNRSWEVTAVTPIYDNSAIMVAQTCDCRLVGTAELQNSLMV